MNKFVKTMLGKHANVVRARRGVIEQNRMLVKRVVEEETVYLCSEVRSLFEDLLRAIDETTVVDVTDTVDVENGQGLNGDDDHSAYESSSL
jgi:predicted ABC-class ATPase